MKTIQEHNKEKQRMFDLERRSGIGCPNCGEEMIYPDNDIRASNPPQRVVACEKCGKRALVLA